MIQLRKIALGIGLASGALLTAWLLTGERKHKTREYISRRSENIKSSLKTKKRVYDDSEAHYI